MKFFIIITLALVSVISHGQDSLYIKGTVKDSRTQVVAGASLRLMNAGDTMVLANTITDSRGEFVFHMQKFGNYFLTISAIGQSNYRSDSIIVDSLHAKILLPLIMLAEAKATELGGVTVKSKKLLIENAIDKTIVNVDAMISAASSNAFEVLSKTPGVTVSSQGDISLNGRAGVLVMIDGRSTYMSAQDLANYLKSIPGSTLDKIELIDNPSARYDASGNAIINIKMKKNRTAGFTGNVSTGYSLGKYQRQNHSLNLNYRNKKINLFTNLGYGYEKNYTNDDVTRRFYTKEGVLSSSVQLQNRLINRGNGMNYMLGLDYTMSKQTTISLLGNLNDGQRKAAINYENENLDELGTSRNTGIGTTNSLDKRENAGVNLNVLHQFTKPGRELSVDLNYLRYKNSGDQQLENYVSEPGNPTEANNFSYSLPSTIKIYTAKADYVQPFKNGKFETGFKSSQVSNDHVTEYYDENGGVATFIPSRSNHFIYKENIQALYLNLQRSVRRWGFQVGLRAEQTHSNGKQVANAAVTDSNFVKDYFQLFPSAYITYKLDSTGQRSLTGMITRRINRPNYQALNPFLFFRDNYTYSGGNPFLSPQYQYRFEVKYQHSQALWMGLSYNRFTQVIFTTTEAVDSIFITRPNNIAKGFMLLLNVGLNVSPTKWWTMNNTARVSRMGLKGDVAGTALTPNTYVVRLELQNNFTLSKTINAELGGYYASIDLNGQTFTKPMYRVYGSIQKKIWNEKGSIRFGLEDIFHSWVYYNRSVDLKQADYRERTEFDSQRFSLAFTYKFGKKSFARKSKSNGNASDEEKGRVD